MRPLVLALAFALAPSASAQTVEPIVIGPVAYPPPIAATPACDTTCLTVVQSRPSPVDTSPPPTPVAPSWAPSVVAGTPLLRVIRDRATTFLIYGEIEGRYLVAGNAATGAIRYAFDLRSLGGADDSWFEEVTYARERGGVLYVSNRHLTYASQTNRRNGYLTAIKVPTGEVLWRSRSLVANARTFVVAGRFLISGYGFTAERDWLYLIDRATGRVRHRVAVPSMPETIALRRGRVLVRTYDHRVVARLSAG